ncbi:peptidyl-prolyl cis-trans isomerase, putative [Babesia caballi]|uniref:Peptidyl-prolyl cis-trans isomerase, putative n=1 Tax=Babesia caballi TaxID=5871 RepID=A0AAV4M137_BABCB|nr:peptidyl-prolyl cis-trans isomerase, putative [Babesia caballi]
MSSLRAFLDIGVGANLRGRVVLEFFDDAGEAVLENFRSLCLGDVTGSVRGKQRKLSYQGCRVYRVVAGSYLECGDFEHNNGDGGSSVFGGYFREMPNIRRHSHAGLLSMKRMGPGGFGSQFFITFGRSPPLDNQHHVFGRVVEGMEFIRAVEHVPVDMKNVPRVEVGVLRCGLLRFTPRQQTRVSAQRELVNNLMESLQPQEESDDDGDAELRCIYTGKVIKKRSIRADSAAAIGKQHLADALAGKVLHFVPQYAADSEYQYYEEAAETTDATKPSDEAPLSPESAAESSDSDVSASGDEAEAQEGDVVMQRLRALSKQLGECSERNRQEVSVEQRFLGDTKKLNEHYKDVFGLREDNSTVNFNRNPGLNKAAIAVEKQHELAVKKDKGKTFGWNVFNQDALYRAHKKRLNETSFNEAEYQLQKAQMGDDFYKPGLTTTEPTEAAKLTVVRNLEKQYKQREKFSRRRALDEEVKDVSYINQRNRVFNQKLDRAFKSHTAEIMQNLERGTAL